MIDPKTWLDIYIPLQALDGFMFSFFPKHKTKGEPGNLKVDQRGVLSFTRQCTQEKTKFAFRLIHRRSCF